MTYCLETLCFTMWLAKLPLNSVLVALSIKQQKHGTRPLHTQTRFQCISSVPPTVRPMFQLILYLGQKSTVGWWYPPVQRDQRENNTPARQRRVAMETREKSGNDVMQENLFFQLSQVFRFRPVTRRNVWLFGAYEIIIFLLVKEKNEQLQTVRYNCQIKYLIFYKYFLIC